jgi:hypothetical protein
MLVHGGAEISGFLRLRVPSAAELYAVLESVTGHEGRHRHRSGVRFGRARICGPNARSAPKGWKAVLAEKHADELEQRVRDLRQLCNQLRG